MMEATMMSKTQYTAIRHRSVLAQTIHTEAWLRSQAQNGHILCKLSGSKYFFKSGPSQDILYFTMSPEPGTNSEFWAYLEFRQKMGASIPQQGLAFAAPANVLSVNAEAAQNQEELVDYYFRYRNYRLLRRFRRNALLGGGLFLAALCCSLSGSVFSMLWALALFGMTAFSLWSYFCFHRACLRCGHTEPQKKPRRPGY